jgi:ribonuclease BN (tRNA processing enzyme)
VRVTILGKSPSWQDADGACSGYLVQSDSTCVLLDCGNGVFSKLRRYRDYTAVDAVVVSHLHADHFLDLIPYAYALTYSPRQQPVPIPPWWKGTQQPARPRLIVPKGATDVFRKIVGTWGQEDLIDNAFRIEEYKADDTVKVGDLEMWFQEVPHFTTTFAICFSSLNGGGRLIYGADCRPGDEIVKIAKDADLFIVEATLPRPERTGVRGHLTPAEAGEHAKKAGVRQVVLTHISDELDELWARDEATKTYGGPVSIAREGDSYEV